MQISLLSEPALMLALASVITVFTVACQFHVAPEVYLQATIVHVADNTNLLDITK